jgi:hypothetical protein
VKRTKVTLEARDFCPSLKIVRRGNLAKSYDYNIGKQQYMRLAKVTTKVPFKALLEEAETPTTEGALAGLNGMCDATACRHAGFGVSFANSARPARASSMSVWNLRFSYARNICSTPIAT